MVSGGIGGFFTHYTSNHFLVNPFVAPSPVLLLCSAATPIARNWLVCAAFSMLVLWCGAGMVL